MREITEAKMEKIMQYAKHKLGLVETAPVLLVVSPGNTKSTQCFSMQDFVTEDKMIDFILLLQDGLTETGKKDFLNKLTLANMDLLKKIGAEV